MLTMIAFGVGTLLVSAALARALYRQGRVDGYRAACEDATKLMKAAQADAEAAAVVPLDYQIALPGDHWAGQVRAAQEGRQ